MQERQPAVVSIFRQLAEKTVNHSTTYFQKLTEPTGLLRDLRGKVLIVKRKNTADYFCRDQYQSQTDLRYAAVFFETLATFDDAEFFVGEVSAEGGAFRSIDRNTAREEMNHWLQEECDVCAV